MSDEPRFLDLAKVCPDLSDLLFLANYVPMVPCPFCVEGWIPDPESSPEPQELELAPGFTCTYLEIHPIPCPECQGEGRLFWLCGN